MGDCGHVVVGFISIIKNNIGNFSRPHHHHHRVQDDRKSVLLQENAKQTYSFYLNKYNRLHLNLTQIIDPYQDNNFTEYLGKCSATRIRNLDPTRHSTQKKMVAKFKFIDFRV